MTLFFHYYQEQREETTIVLTMEDMTRGQYQDMNESVCVYYSNIHIQKKCAADNDVGESESLAEKKRNYHFIPFKNIKSSYFFSRERWLTQIHMQAHTYHTLYCTNIFFDLVTRLHSSVFFVYVFTAFE